jgi:hypothetical protein
LSAAFRFRVRVRPCVDDHDAEGTGDQTGRRSRRTGMDREEDNSQVADWFERSAVSRLMPRRVQGETADHLLGELVRRPGDANRNTATSMTTRVGEPDGRAPGEGEVHGAVHSVQVTRDRTDPAYEAHYRRGAERLRQFAEALDEADFCPACVYGAALEAAEDDQLSYFDRRYSGRRYRPTDNDGIMDGPQDPYPHPGEIDDSGYHILAPRQSADRDPRGH